MAYGIKSTTKTELGDILWSDLTGDSVFDSKNMKASDEVFKTMKGDELGEVTDIQSSYYELEGGYYIKKTAKTHTMANKDYDYPDSSSDTKTSSSGGFLDYVKTFLGFGTEVLKATNAKNTDSTSNNADNSEDENTDTDKSGAAASNNKTWYFVAGFVILLVILVIIFWKPKPAPLAAQPQQQPYLEIKPAQQ
jgi:hypothetical protein